MNSIGFGDRHDTPRTWTSNARNPRHHRRSRVKRWCGSWSFLCFLGKIWDLRIGCWDWRFLFLDFQIRKTASKDIAATQINILNYNGPLQKMPDGSRWFLQPLQGRSWFLVFWLQGEALQTLLRHLSHCAPGGCCLFGSIMCKSTPDLCQAWLIQCGGAIFPSFPLSSTSLAGPLCRGGLRGSRAAHVHGRR